MVKLVTPASGTQSGTLEDMHGLLGTSQRTKVMRRRPNRRDVRHGFQLSQRHGVASQAAADQNVPAARDKDKVKLWNVLSVRSALLSRSLISA
jgi:hypothetical protein